MPTDADKALYRIAEGNILRPLTLAHETSESAVIKAKVTKQIIAGRLRNLREHEGVSLRDVASKLQLSPAYVSDVELGRRNLLPQFAKRYITAVIALGH